MNTPIYDLSKAGEAFQAAMEMEDDNCCFTIIVIAPDYIDVEARYPSVSMTAAGLRKLAAALLEAADLSDKLKERKR